MSYDRKFLVWALCYALAGMGLGIYMAASDNHGQLVAHAHLLLLGFVASLIYAVIHRLWLPSPSRALAATQFVLHQLGVIVMVAGLLLLYGGVEPEAKLNPFLGASSIAVVLGVVLMLIMVLKARPVAAGARLQAGQGGIEAA